MNCFSSRLSLRCFCVFANSGEQRLGGFTRVLIQLRLLQVVISLLAFRILAAKAIS